MSTVTLAIPEEWPEDAQALRDDPRFIRFQQEMALKGLAERTVKEYSRALVVFLLAFGKPAELLTNDDIKTYLIELQQMEFSDSKIKISLSAIRHFWELALKREWTLQRVVKLSRKQKIPTALSVGEVMTTLNNVRQFRHRILLYTLYCTGMRINEGLHLCVGDIDKERMTIVVGKTKGGKRERIVPMPQSLYLALRKFWVTHRNPVLLFPFTGRSHKDRALSSTTTRPMCAGSIQIAMRKAAREVGITRKATPHVLRHSYATYLLECGINLRLIQLYLGHRSANTTARYTHLTQAALSCSHEVLQRLGEIRTDDITD